MQATAATRNFYDAKLRKYGGMYPMRWNLSSGQAADGVYIIPRRNYFLTAII